MKSKSFSWINNHLNFFMIAILLLWIKTYVAYNLEFSLGIENSMQKFLLFLNPASSIILFLGLALFFKGKKAFKWMIIIDFLLSFYLYANIVYYRFYTDFITLPTLTQTSNVGDLGQSILALISPNDILYFVDTIILFLLVVTKVIKPTTVKVKMRSRVIILTAAVALFAVNLGLSEMDRPQLLKRTFDRNYIVKYLGMYNFAIYDAIQSTGASAQRAMADTDDITEVTNYTNAMYAEPNPKYFGAAEGKNVIYIHLESIQNFIIDYKLNGEEVTPFLNSLSKDQNTFYFDNFFHQTGQGKTADAEFMLENSLFGLPQGAAFSTKGRNTYQAQPAILGQLGYTSAVFHGNTRSFWNRDEIYKSFGFDKFFDLTHYTAEENEVVNYGLLDKPFFKQSMPMLESLSQPFYAKFITVTNHFPFPLAQELATIEPHTTGDTSVDNYFQTVRYADEALKEFFDYLKESGLYDNTMIVMYGDHYGISESHKKAMSTVLGTEVGDFENAQLQRVPLFIHIPGVEGGNMHQYGGQIDLLPTVLHLLGVDTKGYVQLGSDLFSKDHQTIVPFRNGDFVTDKVTALNGKYYDTATGEQLEANEEIKQNEKIVQMKLKMSDKIVNQDLLRFYTPEGFEPVDPSDYDYTNRSASSNEDQNTK
ncbi:LTA synthase family protein [Metabacillus rhizolycopersici]|jgi:lipoteichoic acid synthase|uniref:LTA synthase family protein n=1 Tax=Metabacillus rhizolycopersici TaxID=2875709 RepID=A0ABS7UTL7_9BACI|nr:LTA synthase family protein [Metabacillus rhizolycopersici]MBZ5751655.1 LTA synthase family protein [Metabacillus rhizolycopersici]